MSTVVGIIGYNSAYMSADTQITNTDLTVHTETALKICPIGTNIAVGATGDTGTVFPLFNHLYQHGWGASPCIEDIQAEILSFLGSTTSSGLIMIIGQCKDTNRLSISTASFKDLSQWKFYHEPNQLVVLPPHGCTSEDCFSVIQQQHGSMLSLYPISHICRLAIQSIAKISPYVNDRCTIWQLGTGIILHEG